MKPDVHYGAFQCPACNSNDTAAMTVETGSAWLYGATVGIIWCSCGKVSVLTEHKGILHAFDFADDKEV